MDIVDYLRALRRRWRVILLVTIVAGIAALLTAPSSTPNSAVPVGTTYQATTTLLRAPTGGQVDLSLIRLYVKTGEIPQQAAQKLGYKGPPQLLANGIVVGGDNDVGTVTIQATDKDPKRAELVANTFADVTLDYLVESAQKSRQTQLATITNAIKLTQHQLAQTNEDLRNTSDSSVEGQSLQAQQGALEDSLRDLYGQQTSLQRQGTSLAPMNVLEKAEALAQTSSSSPTLTAPSSRSTRLLLGLVLGLLLGGAAALLIERLDTRLQGRESAENSFGLPVIAEIPRMSAALRRSGRVVSVSAPESAAAEAYRGLRASLLLMPSRPVLGGSEVGERVDSGSIVLVTAPTPRSGKSTTAANLAACLAESGRRVLVIDADFRNPAIADLLGVDSEVGLSDLALMGDAGQLDKIVHTSTVAPVRVVTAGRRATTSGVTESRIGAILASARALADVVIVDAAPLLSGGDALDVMPHVDTVLVVGRVRRTTRDQALRARELLARIGVPVLGVALVGSQSSTGGPSGTATLRDRMSGLRTQPGRRRSETSRHGVTRESS